MKPTLRSSELDRALACPGSLTLVPLVAERVSDEGNEGTAIHAAVAARIVGELGAEVPDFDDRPLPAVNPRSQWIVDSCFRTAQEMIPQGWSIQVECAMAYEFGGHFNLSGHVDCLAISPDGESAIGFDWKSGYRPVDVAEQNEQACGYMMLMRRAYPSLKKIAFVIHQPRNDEDEGFPRTSSVALGGDSDELEDFHDSWGQRILNALRAPMQLDTGRTQCRFCPVSYQCPAIQAELELMKHTLTAEEVATLKKQPDPAKVGDFIISARTLKEPIEGATELLHELIDKNGYVDSGGGIRITRKIEKGSYEVTDPVAFFDALHGLLPEYKDMANAVTYSMTKAKKAIADVMKIPATGRAPLTAETVFDAKLRPYTIQGDRRKLIFT